MRGRMGSEDSEQPGWTWTTPQRRLIVALLIALCVVFAIRYGFNRTYVSDPPPERGARFDDVADKIDPATADAATLSALPMLGEQRAQDIIAFRESRRTQRPGERVFNKAEDLVQIRGFGRATVELLRPHLLFPSTPPPTQP